MSWFDIISGGLGVGAGGTAVSVAVYSGAVAVEKEMKKEARDQIASFLKREGSIADDKIICDMILNIFNTTFGDCHFSWRCLTRSVMISTCVSVSITTILCLKYANYLQIFKSQTYDSPGLITSVLALLFLILIMSCIPDYISLGKGRILLNILTKKPGFSSIVLVSVLDVVISLIISLIFLLTMTIMSDRFNLSDARLDFMDILSSVRFFVIGENPKYPLTHSSCYIRSNDICYFYMDGFNYAGVGNTQSSCGSN